LKSKTILASAIALTAATIIGKFFGFLREITLAAVYGAGSVSDAFIVAFAIPSTVLALVGTAASLSFIPLYTSIEQGRHRFVSNILTLFAVVGFVFSLVFALFPRALVFLFASQFPNETFNLAAKLLQIMVWSAIPFFFAEILRGYLQIQKAFFLSVFLTIPINIAAVAGILSSSIFENYLLMAYSVLVGQYLTMAFFFVAAAGKGYRYRPVWAPRDPHIHKLLVMMLPVALAVLLIDLNTIVARNFASSLAAGSVSALNYASKAIGLFSAILGSSLISALYPRLSELAAEGDTERMRKYISSAIMMLTPLLLAIVIGIVLLAEPLTRIMFERGEFSPADTKRTAECLQMYAALALAVGMEGIVSRGLYALHDTKTPAIISAVAIAVGIVLNFILIGPLKHMGLALSTSLSSLLMLTLTLLATQKRLGTFGLWANRGEWLKMLLAAAVMAVVVGWGYQALPVMAGSVWQTALWTMVLVLVGAGVYALALFALRVAVLQDVIALVKRTLGR
jgi:putative peptidoglycan lipid II flippase